MNKLLLSALLTVSLGACAQQVSLPSNVKSILGAHNANYIDQVDFSYSSANPIDFARAKLCVAENISNNEVTLQDSVGTFFGAYSGTYYQKNNAQVMQGKDVFKYADEGTATLIANGTTTATSQAMLIPITDVVKFEMKLALVSNGVVLKFSNITRAQKETGFSANNGFNPVGTWSGARSQEVYGSLETVVNKIKACLN